jgi:cbb3-type cytochrome oxidase subunit 1
MTTMTSYILGLILFTVMVLCVLWLGAENKKKGKIPNWALKLCLYISVFLALGEVANIVLYLIKSIK